MLNKSAAIVLLLGLTAPLANAFTVFTTEVKKGTITAIDPETNTIELTNKKTQDMIELSDKATFVVKGMKQAGIADLKEGHEITIKKRLIKDSLRRIEGKVVSVNHDNYSARVRDTATREVLEVHFSKKIKVKGEIDQFTDIARGQHISLQYTNKNPSTQAQ